MSKKIVINHYLLTHTVALFLNLSVSLSLILHIEKALDHTHGQRIDLPTLCTLKSL